MASGMMIAVLGVLFASLAGFLVYTGALTLYAGLALLGFVVSVGAMLKFAGEGSKTVHKVIAGVLFVIALACMGVFVWQEMKLTKPGSKVDVAALHLEIFEVARAETFARALKEVAPNSRALLLTGSVKENESLIQAQTEKLKEVLGSSIEIVAEESFPVELIPREYVPRYGLTKETDAKAFEAAILRHKDCNLVISLVGLPRNHWKVGIWRWNELARPKMAFLEGEPKVLARLAQRGVISLFAAYLPGWTFVEKVPKDAETAFSMRYVLYDDKGVFRFKEKPKSEEGGASAKSGENTR